MGDELMFWILLYTMEAESGAFVDVFGGETPEYYLVLR
jgi:hypothetical protein